MSQQTATLPPEPLSRTLTSQRGTLIGLTIGVVALGLLFHGEIAVAIRTWIDSTAYNHCFLVIPIAAYLIWERRPALRGLRAKPLPIAALLVPPLGIAWLAAERLGIMEGRQLVAITTLEVLCLAVLGWRLYLAVSGPLLYLYFLVPFGEFLTPKLQDVTTWFTRHGLDILGIPAYIDGYVIEIPEGTFFVAEACAGLRFLIASIAFGVLYALLMYRGPWRRAVFIAVSIVMPIIANGFRALGIVWLGHILGSAEAAAADHVLYGWIFFSIVILLLILLGLPFREDDLPSPAIDATGPDAADHAETEPAWPRHGLLAVVSVVALACLGPAVALALNQASGPPEVALRPLNLAPACTQSGATTVSAGSPGRTIVQHVMCGGAEMIVQVEVFSPRSTAAPINGERRRMTRPREADDISEVPLTTKAHAPLPPWRLVRADEPSRLSVAGLWIDGKPTAPGMAMRLLMARTSVTGGADAPVVVAITPVADWSKVGIREKERMESQIIDLLLANPSLGAQIQAIAKAAR